MKKKHIFPTCLLLFIFFCGFFSLPLNCLALLTNTDLNGNYIAILQEADTDDKLDFGCRLLLNFKGNGKGTIQFLECNNSNTGSDSFTYNVNSDGTFTIAGSDPIHGIITEDGEIGTLSVIEEPVDDVTLFVFVKKSSGMSNASIIGSYIAVTQETDGDASRTLLTFDGQGNGIAKTLENQNGKTYSESFTYNVSSDGTFSVTNSGHGIISADGEMGMVSHIEKADDASMIVFLKKSTGMSNSKLKGDYIFVAQNTDYEGIRMLATFDGKGSGTYQHLESVYSGPNSGTFTYKVSTDGTYTLSPEGFVTGKGIVSSDGTVATLIFFNNDFTEMHVGIKKSAGEIDSDGDGYTVSEGDCDDADADINPGEIEICGDGIDQDCDGKDEECLPAPPAPTGVSASDGTLSGKVMVDWNAVLGASSYDVYRADMPAWTGTAPKRIASSVTGTSYDDTSAISGSRYYYWVKSRNSGGVSKYSNFDEGYWGTPGSIPSVPANVDAEDGASGMVTVTWTGSQDTLVYEVYRADLPAYLDFNLAKIATVTDALYEDMSAVEGNRYYYWIKARNSWGVSRYSTFDTGYVGTASSPLAAPMGISATNGTVSGKVTITWLTSTGAMGYEIWRAIKLVSEGGTPVRVGYLSGTSFDDTTATNGVTYYYWVKSRDSWGSSKYSVPDTGYHN